MSNELNEANAMEAYCRTIDCTGVGAAATDCPAVLPKTIKVVVPSEMHVTYPTRMLQCAIQICTAAPYEWSVEDREPDIADTTTYQQIFDNWFKQILAA